MDLEENKDLVRRQFELLGKGDIDGAANLWSVRSLNHGREVDRNALRKVYSSLQAIHETHELHEVIAEGEWVVVRTTCTGIHSATPEIPVNGGVFVGVKPTGRSNTVQHIHMFRVQDGSLTEHWAARDDLGAARQIGLELKQTSV